MIIIGVECLRRESLDPGSLDDGDVAVDRKIGEGFCAFTGLRPADLQFVDFCTLTNAQHLARIM